MRVLVTGGAGFIGSHVVDQLCCAGHEPVVFDALLPAVHPSGEWPEYLRDDVERIKGDVRDGNAIRAAMEGVDVVLHLAAAVGVGESAYEIGHYVSCNTHGTAVLLEQLINLKRRPNRLLVAGSMSSYGEGLYTNGSEVFDRVKPRTEKQLEARRWEYPGLRSMPTDETKPLDIQSVYAQTKRDQEDLAIVVGEQHDIEVTVPRFFNVYGERQSLSNPYTGVAAIFSSMIANDTAPRVYEDGKQSRDFIHVSDVANAVVQLGTSHNVGGVGPVNIGTGKPTTINQLATALLELYGKRGLGLDVRHQYRVGDIRHCYANADKLRGLLPDWATVPLEEGLAMLCNWAERQDCEDKSLSAHRELVERGLLR